MPLQETFSDRAFADGDLLLGRDVSDQSQSSDGSTAEFTSSGLVAYFQSKPLAANLSPDADDARSLGSPGASFANIHTTRLTLNGVEMDGTTLGDPGADRILFFDSSANTTAYLQVGTALSISGTVLSVDAASTSQVGVVNLATAAEVSAGVNLTKAITPNALATSETAKEVVIVELFAPSEDVVAGDDANYFDIPEHLNGWSLTRVAQDHKTVGAGTTQTTTDVQIHNERSSQDLLTTKSTVNAGATNSNSATAAVIDPAQAAVQTADRLRFDIDAVPETTAPAGQRVHLTFSPPSS